MSLKLFSISPKKQAGFLIPAALFIVVALSALAIAILKISTQSTTSSFREGISVQALYAAESASGYAMNRLFMPTPSRSSATARCAALVGISVSFNRSGLKSCSSALNCSSVDDSTGNTTFYTVTSSAECGSGGIRSQRIIKTSAYLQ